MRMKTNPTGLIASIVFVSTIVLSPTVVTAQGVGLEDAAIRQQVEAYRSAAERHVRRNNLSAAIQNFQKILEVHRLGQNDVDILYNLGLLSESRSQCKAVVLYFQAYLRATMGEDGRAEIEKKLEKCIRRLGTVQNVTIYTVPARAAVRINDVFVGYSPVRNFRLPVQNVRLRAEKLDHHPAKVRYSVKSGQTNSTTLSLTKKIYYGNLEVQVVAPASGAVVFLNKVRVGPPPYKREKLAEGRYLLHLEKSGWDNWVRYITISRNSTLKVNVKMEDTDTMVAIPPLPDNNQ